MDKAAGPTWDTAPPGGVIFDCDGVLVDSEPMSNAVLIASFARYGLTIAEADIADMFQGGTIHSVAERARAMGADLPADWVAETYAAIYARLRRGTPPMPGIGALLDALDAAAIPYAVASNGSLEKMEITLGQTGLWPRFQGRMLSAHSAGTAKPDPGLFLLAAETIGRAPRDCVVIEDSVTGCIAARGAGMRCLGLAVEGDGARLAAADAQVVRSLAAAARALGLAIPPVDAPAPAR